MSTRPTGAAMPSMVDSRPAVTVIAGFSPAATLAVCDNLLATDHRLILLHHDISDLRSGTVRRQARTATAVLEDKVVTLAHGCVSCTLRQDVMPALARLSRRHPGHDLVLALPATIEPEDVASACRHCTVDGVAVGDLVRFDSYVTVVDAATFTDDLHSTDGLRDRDLHAAHDDGRSIAQTVARQVEFADTIVVWDGTAGAFDTIRAVDLAAGLAPWATLVAAGDDLSARLRRTGRHDPQIPGITLRALECRPIGVHDPDGYAGVSSMLFDSRRPFHPQRLFEALPTLTGSALRGRGQLWIATQPGTVIAWESAGQSIGLTPLGSWLAALPPARWPEISDLRRLAADATWDPYYGDRRTALAFIGLDTDPAVLHTELTACLLTDAELAAGAATWATLPDPFAGFFEENQP